MLEGFDAGLEGGGGVGGVDGTLKLGQDAAMVKLLIDEVEGGAGDSVAGGEHGLMDMVAIHALATVARQQGRMAVDDAALPFVDNSLWHISQETGQSDQVDMLLAEPLDDMFATATPFRIGEVEGGDAKALHTVYSPGIGAISEEAGDMEVRSLGLGVEGYGLGIRAFAGGEDGYVNF